MNNKLILLLTRKQAGIINKTFMGKSRKCRWCSNWVGGAYYITNTIAKPDKLYNTAKKPQIQIVQVCSECGEAIKNVINQRKLK